MKSPKPLFDTARRAMPSLTGNTHGVLSVLMTRFTSMGDVAMSIPVVYSVCRTYPDVRFVMVTRVSVRDMFVGAPDNLQVVGVDLRHDYKGARGLWRLCGELMAEYRFDAYADLQNRFRTRLMGAFLRLRGVIVAHLARGSNSKHALTRRRNKMMLPLISQRARYREVFARLGLPVSEHFEGLYPAPRTADSTLFGRIHAPRAEGEKWIGIAPFATRRGKTYPTDQMERVLELILDSYPEATVFIFGGDGDEARIADTWAEKHPRTVSLAGKRYGFAAELALQNHLDLMLAMDSANLHLASLVGVPTLSIWGATHPYCGFRAWRQREADTVQLPLSCRPCSVSGDRKCYRGDYLCLTAIRPDMIFNRLKTLL